MKFERLRAVGVIALCCLLAVGAGEALAQASSPTLVQQHGDWELFTHDGSAGKVCFLLSKPTRLEPSDRDHGDVFFFVSARPSNNVDNEASVLVGYTFMEGSEVIADVDGQKFTMFIDGNGAWVRDAADEDRLVAAMRAGRVLTVTGQSSRGTNVRYTFSLSGVTAGTNQMRQVCS